jgi:hypothetical protein
MSIISSPFDLGANLFTQQYAAVTPGEGGSIGSEYDTAGKIRSGWRNCKLTTGQAKTKMAGVLSESTTWSDGEWTDFLESELKTFFPVNRHRSTCEVSAWGAWSECGRIPDDAIIPEDSLGGQQFRERTVVKPKLYNCVEQDCDKELIEFRECEPPTDDEGGNGGDEGGNGGDDGGNGGDDGGNGGDDGGNGGDDSGNGGDDSDTDSFTDKLKEHWVLIGLGFVGLALLG